MAEFQVRNVFMPPTALKLMRQVANPSRDCRLRSIGSGGETLGAELLGWGREVFGLTINEFYGQTECNLVLSNCAGLMPVKPGSMGRPVPGHEVAVVDETGVPLAQGETGVIAVRRPDPVMFLEYWQNPAASAAKFAGDWLLTGDTGRVDEDGFFHFVGREDDIITSGGYRIGSRPSSCWTRPTNPARSWPRRSRTSSGRAWPRTSTRARWPSSSPCP
jgi:acetyl-CoA synthetase